MKLLHRAPTWLAVEKPAGVTVIPGRGEDQAPSLVERLQVEFGRKLWVVHRLDRDTSGVLLFALDAPTHRTLSMAFEAGRIEKRYLALVEGDLADPLDVGVALAPARRGRMRPVRPGEEGKSARTLVTPVQRLASGKATLVEAVPLTGRTHQIRVHLLSAGHPLLFDHQYGRKAPLNAEDLGGEGAQVVLARTPLHASRVRLTGLDGIDDAELTSPLPEDMARAVELLSRMAR